MKYIPTAVTRKVARTVLVAQKNSPTLLFAGGVVGVVGAAVLACRATLKVEAHLEKTKIDIFQAHEVLAANTHPNAEAEHKKDLVYIYVDSTVRLCKLYAPAILLGGASIAALMGSHNILNKRNAALTAAYASLEKAWESYRKRVVDEFGEEKERELYYDIRPCEIEDEVTGKKTVAKKSLGGGSIYARFFSPETSPTNWSPVPEYNMLFLKCQQNYANDRLKSKGHVFLNEIYDALGLERSKEGAVVGWVWNGDGDNMVDFGIFDQEADNEFYEFIIGRQGIWLDFNVDGVIYDKI